MVNTNELVQAKQIVEMIVFVGRQIFQNETPFHSRQKALEAADDMQHSGMLQTFVDGIKS